METAALLEQSVNVDAVEELRLRAWARRNYRPLDDRDADWHPIILDEMRRKDRERNCARLACAAPFRPSCRHGNVRLEQEPGNVPGFFR